MSNDVQTCQDPIRLTLAARMLGRSPRTLTRWARAGRLVIYRDQFTTIRFVSRARVLELLPTAETGDPE